MSLMEFVVVIVGVLAWPICILVVFLVLRRAIRRGVREGLKKRREDLAKRQGTQPKTTVAYHQFTCARCGGEFISPTTEAQLNRELLNSGQPMSSGISEVCDDCYRYVIGRAKADGLIP